MSDSAFASAAYPGFTKAELISRVAAHDEGQGEPLPTATYDKMRAEIRRRDRAEAGDVDAMTPGERLRHVRANR